MQRSISFLGTGLFLAYLVVAAMGCASSTPTESVSYIAPSEMDRVPSSSAPYAELFKDDQSIMSDAEIDKALSYDLILPARAKLAVVRFGQRPSWWGWSEEFVRSNEKIDAEFLDRLGMNRRISDVAYLPGMVTPAQMTIPRLRQSAARFQADFLLIYHTTSRNYDREKLFRAGETKAYCTVEAVLLDIRSGIIPFSAVANETFSATRSAQDIDFNETIAKANQQAIGKAWLRVADQVNQFLDKLPPSTRPAT